jgi:hypothetical protein
MLPCLAAVLFVVGACTAPAQVPAPQGAAPTLVVLITVDQLRGDYLDRWRGQLTGGFKRLLEEGASFSDAHQDHAVTETAPGHASLLSGRFPRSTGITRNAAGVGDPASADQISREIAPIALGDFEDLQSGDVHRAFRRFEGKESVVHGRGFFHRVRAL